MYNTTSIRTYIHNIVYELIRDFVNCYRLPFSNTRLPKDKEELFDVIKFYENTCGSNFFIYRTYNRIIHRR